MMSLIYQIVLIMCQKFKIILKHHENHETLTAVSPIHVYINRTCNRLVFKIKDGYKLETMKQ